MVSFIDAIDANIIWTIVCVPLMEVFQSTGSTVLLIIIGRLTLANKDQNEKVSALIFFLFRRRGLVAAQLDSPLD